MIPILLFLGGALALIGGVLHKHHPTFNVELFHGTNLMTPDVMEALLLYLPTSPAVEGTATVVGDIIDGTSAAVEDVVDTIRSAAVLASSGFIQLSETSRSDIGFYGPDYFYDLELDFVLFDVLEEVDVAKGTGALLAMDIPFEVPDVDKTAVEADSHTVDVEVEVDEDEDDGCDNDDGDNMDYSMFFLCSIWIYCLWGTIPFIGKLVYKLPLVKGIVADIRNDLKNLPFLLFQLAYVCAGTYLLEQAAMGVFFFDPLARIGWLMERGRIDTTFLAQELAVLYLWAWWKTVVPAERTLAQLKMGLALEDWVRCDTEDREIISVEGSLTRRVLETLDEPTHMHRVVDMAEGLRFWSLPSAQHEATVWLDGLG